MATLSIPNVPLSTIRSITQWIILFRNTRRSVCAEIVLRSLKGYRLAGNQKFELVINLKTA